jgi:hypothetical protein
MFVANCVGTDPCLSQIVWTQIPVCRDLCSHSLWQTGICVHIICDKQGPVSTQVVTNRDLSCLSQTVWKHIRLLQIVWTQIPVCHNLCENKSLLVTNCVCAHRSLFVTNCMDTDPCLSQTVCCDKQGSVFTQVLTNRDLCSHSLWQRGICVYIVCDKQGSVSTQDVTNRDLCPHNLWQTGNCVRTVYDKQGSVYIHFPVCHKLCGHRSLFVTNCVDTDPCLSQTVWTQIPVYHKLCGHKFVTNRDLCLHSLWQAGICVHTGCDKQGSVSTQFMTNMDLCPHSLWQTRICVHTICDKQGSTICDKLCVCTQIPVCHKLYGHRSLFVTNYVDTDPCLS